MGNIDRVLRDLIALAFTAVLIIAYQAFIVAGARYCPQAAPGIGCEIVSFIFGDGVPRR